MFAHSFYNENSNASCIIDNGGGDIHTIACKDIGLSDAAGALHAQLGDSARYIWGIGLLGRISPPQYRHVLL